MINLQVSVAAKQAAKAHAIEAYPNECCGVLKDGAYVRCTNISTVRDTFLINAVEWHALQPVQAVIHSHPEGPDHPSQRDMQSQIDMDIPWGIVLVGKNGPNNEIMAADPWFWSDDFPPVPLIGRDFRHGPSGTDQRGDCYAMIRDIYRSEASVIQVEIDKASGRNRGPQAPRHGVPTRTQDFDWFLKEPILLDDIPRDDSWWRNGENLYLENFQKVGFEPVVKSITGLQIGDVLLTKLVSKVPNHGMVYVGNALIMHHKATRASNIEPVHRWFPNVTHVLRYRGKS
jgi:proteasome lid subunit RPN8/RPN11